jgi:hypothetical protein
MLYSKFSLWSVSKLHSTACCFCVILSTAFFYISPLLSVRHRFLSFGSLSLCPLLFSTIYQLSPSTLQSTSCWFCVTMSTAKFYSLPHSIGTPHFTVPWSCVPFYCCLLLSVQYLPVTHTVVYVGSVSLYTPLSSKIFPMSVSTSKSSVLWFSVTVPIAVSYSL